MKMFLKEILLKINFAEKYAKICNAYTGYELGMNFTKLQVDNMLHLLGIDLRYASKDKTFYNDFSCGVYHFRLAMTFKYGFVECFYTIWSNQSGERLSGRFNSIATIQDEAFKDKVLFNFPIATSINDLEEILKQIIDLHTDFTSAFEQSISKKS